MQTLQLPGDPGDLCTLRAGDELLLSGPALTARDATHIRMLQILERGGGDRRADASLPGRPVAEPGFDELLRLIAGQLFFYAGPTPARAGLPFGAVGPTTAARLDGAAIRLLDFGVMSSLGKGSRGSAFKAAVRRRGGVYFAAVGGAAALLARHVSSAELLLWPELGTEALMRVYLRDFPVFVAIDSRGTDMYEQAPQAWRAVL